MFSTSGIVIIAGISDTVIIVGGVTDIVHTISTASYRESTLAADTGLVTTTITTIIIITTIESA
ncbi:MAG: hypothetical protein AB7U75_05660 [Hyphomicrobiaceae bacterium]|nr:hypothetical protein [Hyphomicrobiaceae bacterium]